MTWRVFLESAGIGLAMGFGGSLLMWPWFRRNL